MNIVNKLTIRHLKENKRRTLVTIIGVIISVAMLTAVATIGVSFLDLMKKQAIADDGFWHVVYEDVNQEQLKAIQNDENTKELILSKDIGYAPLTNSQNEHKPYLFIKAYSDQGYKNFPITLSEGRLPQAANEVVISESIKTNAKVEYKIGETLNLNIGQRFSQNEESNRALDQTDLVEIDENGKISEQFKQTTTQEFTVVGTIERPTWEPTWSPGYTIITYLDESIIGKSNVVNATVVLKQLNNAIFEAAEQFAKKHNIETVHFNNNLLRYSGAIGNDGLRTTLYSLSAIIMIVIIIGSVSLIYNAFAISVSERSRHLGMLSSVGATRKQKQNSVFFEGAVIGLISIPIGIICGLAGIAITFWFINSLIQNALDMTVKLTVVVTPWSILVACAVSIITIFISTYVPAKRASKISAIDAIRQTSDIKLTEKAVKTSNLVRKLFGIEAEIGLKNLKRNKRRYQATVISLVVSIVLFLAVSYFTDNLKKSLILSQDGVNYDMQVYMGIEEDEMDEMVKSILSLQNVKESSFNKDVSLSSWIDESMLAKELKGQDSSAYKDGKYPYYVKINTLDAENLKSYANKVGADYEQLINTDQLSAIVIDTILYEDGEAGKYVETKGIQTGIGETIDLYYEVWDENGDESEEEFLNKITVGALTDQFPMGVQSAGLGGLNIIMSEQVLNHLLSENQYIHTESYLYLKSSDPLKTQQEIEEMEESNIHVYNVYQANKRDEQMVVLMSVFVYGFIALITAISIANIFNTISTSISLRKREFAMLKSVGMTPKGFNKMINYESIFYGIKSILYGLPISIAVMFLIHKALMNTFSYPFTLPWASLLYVMIAVFIIVGSAMVYSSGKVKKENIIDTLKQENI